MRNQGFDTCTKNASERCSCALYSKNPQKSNRKDFAHFCGGKKPQHNSWWPGQIMRRLAGAAKGRWLEVDLGVVVAALQQLFHLLLGRLARVGAGAGIGNRVLCDLGQSLEEYVLGDKACSAG